MQDEHKLMTLFQAIMNGNCNFRNVTLVKHINEIMNRIQFHSHFFSMGETQLVE
jgi:hypothetical protein